MSLQEYSNDQITCQLSSLTLYTAAVGTTWPLLSSAPTGQAALYLFQKHLLCWGHIHSFSYCGFFSFFPSLLFSSLLFSSLLFSSLLFSSLLFSSLLFSSVSSLLFSSLPYLLFSSFPYLLFFSFLFSSLLFSSLLFSSLLFSSLLFSSLLSPPFYGFEPWWSVRIVLCLSSFSSPSCKLTIYMLGHYCTVLYLQDIMLYVGALLYSTVLAGYNVYMLGHYCTVLAGYNV